MVDTADILLKAAEDVSSGMWCKGEWFADHLVIGSPLNIDLNTALASRRCGEASLAVATMLLGGGEMDYLRARRAVTRRLPACGHNSMMPLPHFNDEHLPDDPFEAGQVWAGLFRGTADSL